MNRHHCTLLSLVFWPFKGLPCLLVGTRSPASAGSSFRAWSCKYAIGGLRICFTSSIACLSFLAVASIVGSLLVDQEHLPAMRAGHISPGPVVYFQRFPLHQQFRAAMRRLSARWSGGLAHHLLQFVRLARRWQEQHRCLPPLPVSSCRDSDCATSPRHASTGTSRVRDPRPFGRCCMSAYHTCDIAVDRSLDWRLENVAAF